jgi:uroporphyrinogen decarboxylase
MSNKKFFNALENIPQPTPPIWFMRQAGRYHSHYQNLKTKNSFVELCKTPSLAAETALGPIESFDFDVAILFSDILFPLESLGMELTYSPGPKFGNCLTEESYKKVFKNKFDINSLSFQGEALQRTLEVLPEDKSLIGFVGGPCTLLAYAMGLNKISGNLKISDFQWRVLNDVLIPTISENIEMQLSAGAELIMIFDSSAHLLGTDDFTKYIEKMFDQIFTKFSKKIGYYAKDYIDYDAIISLNGSKGACLAGVGIDSKEPLTKYFTQSRDYFIQGNFDEKKMLLPNDSMKLELEKYINGLSNFTDQQRAGWICGLGHGILKETPEENVKTFVKMIREAF